MAEPDGPAAGERPPPPEPMDHAQRSVLWQQRVFEAEAGMTNYLARHHGGADLPEWLQVKSQIYADLPTAHTDDDVAWQKVFFRAQALMEKFLVSRFGRDEIERWARFNSEVHEAVEGDRGNGAGDVLERLARQAELYSSEHEYERLDEDSATLLISHCAIWDYRERARERGVPITLESPCEYCTRATEANIRARGYDADYELLDNGRDKGCRWRARRPREEIGEELDTCAASRVGSTGSTISGTGGRSSTG